MGAERETGSQGLRGRHRRQHDVAQPEGEPRRPGREAAKRCDLRGVRAVAYGTVGAGRGSRGRRPEGRAVGRSELGNWGEEIRRRCSAARGVGVGEELRRGLVLHGYSMVLIGRTGALAHPAPGLGPPLTNTMSEQDS